MAELLKQRSVACFREKVKESRTRKGTVSTTHVFVRLAAHDGLEAGPAVVFGPAAIDVAGPVITNFRAAQDSGTETVPIRYAVADAHMASLAVRLEASTDAGQTWQLINPVPVTGGFAWDAGVDFPNRDNAELTLRLTATDDMENISTATTEVTIDTKAPYGLSRPTVTPTDDGFLVAWDGLVSEQHFLSYVITYGEPDNTTPERWDVRDDSDLALLETRSTLIAGLRADTAYQLTLEARDAYGHVTLAEPIEARTLARNAEPDLVTPIVDALPETTAETTIEVGGSALPDSTVTIIVDGATVETGVSVDNDGSFSADVTLPVGDHVIEVVAIAPDGTESPTSDPQEVIVVELLPVPSVSSVGGGSSSSGSSSGGGSGSGSSGPASTMPSVPTGATGIASEGSGSSSADDSGTVASEASPSGTSARTVAAVVPVRPVTQADLAVPVREDIAAVALLNAARVSKLMPVPVVEKAEPSASGASIRLAGTAMPRSKIAVFIHSEQAVMYTAEADEDGYWSFEHEQKHIELAPGRHTAYSIAYDEGSGVKSRPSEKITFEIRSTFLSRLGRYFDLKTTVITLLVACAAFAILFALRRSHPNV